MSNFYKINLKLDDGYKELYINKQRITRFYTFEDEKSKTYKLLIYVDCGTCYEDDAETRYTATFDNPQDLINQVNKITS